MASKRGISDVVSTVLIILLVVAAVAVVGAIVLRTINNASKTVQGSVSCQDVQITPTKCIYTNNAANSTVLVSRSNGGASTSVVNLTFIFINSNAGETRTIGANIPNVLETKSYDANNYGGVLSTVTVPSYVAVAATIKGPSGNVLCPASANVKCLNGGDGLVTPTTFTFVGNDLDVISSYTPSTRLPTAVDTLKIINQNDVNSGTSNAGIILMTGSSVFGGIFNGSVVSNYSNINGGTFNKVVTLNTGSISGGTFEDIVNVTGLGVNPGESTEISGGLFNARVILGRDNVLPDYKEIITNGQFERGIINFGGKVIYNSALSFTPQFYGDVSNVAGEVDGGRFDDNVGATGASGIYDQPPVNITNFVCMSSGFTWKALIHRCTSP